MKNLKKLLYQDWQRADLGNWAKTKRRWAKTLKSIPNNSLIYQAYQELLAEGKIVKNSRIEKSLQIRKIRTLSGIAPFAVMMKPHPCPGNCLYCVNEPGMPKSYMSDEPAAARAKMLDFDPKAQVLARLKQLENIGHQPQKLQIIVIGATFSAYPRDYKYEFIKTIFDACNGQISKTLKTAQKLNEQAKYRIIGMSVETRPDWINLAEIKLMRELGITKVQLGVQSLDSQILKNIKRGHGVTAIIKATKMLRDHGFKINYHLMPNLPGSMPNKDLADFKKVFADSRFRPDTIKIYPCIVLPKTGLCKLWQEGKYKSYDDETLTNLLIKMKTVVPPYCRIDRLVRDITANWTASGTKKTNMRQIVVQKMVEQKLTCQCIRCREVRDQSLLTPEVKLKTLKYRASGGWEYFLSFEDDKYLYAMLRLRLVKNTKPGFKVLEKGALVRELQVFGRQVQISSHSKSASQHQSLGKQLLAKAEDIALKQDYEKIAIISGVGVRDYYCKLGYELKQTYMVKSL